MVNVNHYTIQGATATTTGAAIRIANALKVVLVGKRSAHSSGSTAFSLEVSNDGTNWITYNKLISNVTNTNAQTLTRVASFSLAANGVAFATMSPEDGFEFARVTATETTDGTHDAWLYVEFNK